MRKALDDIRAATLTQGVCEIVANNESKHAAMIVLCSLSGALIRKGEAELVEKIADLIATL